MKNNWFSIQFFFFHECFPKWKICKIFKFPKLVSLCMAPRDVIWILVQFKFTVPDARTPHKPDSKKPIRTNNSS